MVAAPTGAHTWLLNLPPTRRQTRWVIAIASCQIAAFALVAPFAQIPLAQVNGFLTAFAGIIFVTNLVTSVLLFSQFAIQRQRALLVLACGYFLSALLIIPNVLTFPGTFSPTGLLGAGLQTSLWLYWFWHLSFSLALLGYGLMRSKKAESDLVQASPLAVIVQSVALLLALAGGLTLLATAGQDYLPVVYVDRISRGPVPSRLRGVWPIMMLVSVSGLAVLWFRRRSLLDQWLMIIALAAILENGLIPFYTTRFSLGFYAIRLFTLLTSTIVLVVLLAETMRLYGRLQESEAKFRAAIDGIAGLVAIMAPSGELESVNRQIIEYFGRSVEELKDWGTGDAVHPDDLSRVRESFGTSLAGGIPFHQELRLRRFDGEYRWFENRGAPIRDESGRITRWYCLLTDIEDRTQALARLQQMQSDFAHINRVNTMGELAASLSHEILHPIATARNNARAGMRFLEMNPPNFDEVKEALGCVVRDVDRAKDIVGRVRNQIKKAPPRREPFDLNEAVRETLVMVRSAIARNKIAITAHLTDELIRVQGDRVQLQQVVVNLILNAVEAISSEEYGARELSIRIEQQRAGDGGVLVQVRDSGLGIDRGNVDRVFEPFYTTKSTGVGMGLSICRSIINDHGGRLWAEPNDPRGAVFQFTLPPAQEGL
jgi:PAS domain S-box-containing protein